MLVTIIIHRLNVYGRCFISLCVECVTAVEVWVRWLRTFIITSIISSRHFKSLLGIMHTGCLHVICTLDIVDQLIIPFLQILNLDLPRWRLSHFDTEVVRRWRICTSCCCCSTFTISVARFCNRRWRHLVDRFVLIVVRHSINIQKQSAMTRFC